MLIQFSKTKQKLQAISKYINLELEHNSYVSEYSIISVDLVRSVHYLNKLTAFMLMKTLLRFGDLYQLNIYDLIHFNKFDLLQQKTKKHISQNFIINLDVLRWEMVTLDNFYDTINYQSTSRDIKKFFFNKKIFQNVPWKNDCHVFRHVVSSWLDSLDYPTAQIAEKLGDTEETVKKSYIHPEIFRSGIYL